MAWSIEGASAYVGDCLWSAPVIVRGLTPSPVESHKVALVNCSCHWVTSLMGRFLWHLLWWTRCVIPISCQTTECWSTQRGLACRQAHEPREGNHVSFLWLDFSLWLVVIILWLVHSSTRWYNHPTHSITFLQTSCSKLFSVASFESLLCSLVSSSGAL